MSSSSPSTSTVIVVGAAGGIGLEIVKQLMPRHVVLALVLNQEQADEAL
jgi:NAD(P)-dependent dehydrogenase (short-subunit alcohol dehydrogenase family)